MINCLVMTGSGLLPTTTMIEGGKSILKSHTHLCLTNLSLRIHSLGFLKFPLEQRMKKCFIEICFNFKTVLFLYCLKRTFLYYVNSITLLSLLLIFVELICSQHYRLEISQISSFCLNEIEQCHHLLQMKQFQRMARGETSSKIREGSTEMDIFALQISQVSSHILDAEFQNTLSYSF